MTANDLSLVLLGAVGVLVQLVFRYVPAVKDWYNIQENRGLIMLGVVVLVALANFGLSCTPLSGVFGAVVSCTKDGAFETLKALFLIAAGNQLTYLFTRG